MQTYLVDVGRRVPFSLTADNPAMAVFHATLMMDQRNIPMPETLTVLSDEGVTRFKAAERKCRVCGCTEDKACKGGCCWMEWDLCSKCVE